MSRTFVCAVVGFFALVAGVPPGGVGKLVRATGGEVVFRFSTLLPDADETMRT